MDQYQQLDEDIRLIEGFDATLHDAAAPLGAKLKRYVEEYRPAVDRVTTFLAGWTAEDPTSPVTVGPEPATSDDDVPF